MGTLLTLGAGTHLTLRQNFFLTLLLHLYYHYIFRDQMYFASTKKLLCAYVNMYDTFPMVSEGKRPPGEGLLETQVFFPCLECLPKRDIAYSIDT